MLTSALDEPNNPTSVSIPKDILNRSEPTGNGIHLNEEELSSERLTPVNNTPQPIGPVLNQANPNLPSIYSPSYQRKRSAYRGLTITAVLLNPLFAIFLYIAISSAIDESRNELDLENKFWEVFFIILNISISSLSGISDVIVVNPIEETEELLKALGNNQLTERLNHLPACERRAITGFNYFNQAIGNSVFLVGSASAALSVTYISSSTGVQWGLGVPVTILSHIYLNMLSRAKIDEHSYQLLHRLLNKNESMIAEGLKSPLKSLEVLIQVFVNALNRGITYGYIMQQVLKEYFNENDSNQNVIIPLISYATASSFYTFLVSRTLNVHKQFFNPQFEELSADLLKDTKVSYFGNFVDITMTLLRAGAASTLLFRHGPANLPLNIFLTSTLGLFLTSHGLYVRHKNRLYQTALDKKLIQLISALRVGEQQMESELSAEEMFNLIQKQFTVKNSIKISATIINGGSRFADWFSFLGFLTTLNKVIGANNALSFDFYDLLCIQQLLCNPALENALSFFQEGIIDTLAYYRTKLHLEWSERHFGWGSLIKSKSDYPKSYLKKFLPIQERELELAQRLPLHSTLPLIQSGANENEREANEQKSPVRPITLQFEQKKIKAKEDNQDTSEKHYSNGSIEFSLRRENGMH